MTTTSIGHAITAIVMLAICPIALSWIGASEELESQLEISDPAFTQNEVPPTQIARVEESSDEDIVEIIR